jgi:hypothetical protein
MFSRFKHVNPIGLTCLGGGLYKSLKNTIRILIEQNPPLVKPRNNAPNRIGRVRSPRGPAADETQFLKVTVVVPSSCSLTNKFLGS